MVNLKDHFIEKAQSEAEFKKGLKNVLRLIAKGDEEFINKSILAIRDIIKDENIDSRPKYYLLQIINLGCQLNVKAYYNILGDKFLERLYLFACFDKKNPNYEQRGRNLLKEINPDSNEEYSLRFYELLIEMFDYWGEDNFALNFEDFAAKYRMLKKAGIEFPRQHKHLNLYTEYTHEFRKTNSDKENAVKNDKRVSNNGQVNLIDDEELRERLQELKNMRMLIQEHLNNNKEATYLFDDYFQLMEEQLTYLEKYSGDLSSNKEYQINKQYVSIYHKNKDNYKEVRRLLCKVSDDSLLPEKNVNPFNNTSFEDYVNVSDTSNRMDFKKKVPSNVLGDVVSNKTVNVQVDKSKKPTGQDTQKLNSKEDKSDEPEKDETDEMLMEFLRTERSYLMNKIKDLERKMGNLKADNDRFQKKVHDQELTIKNLESKLDVADKENQHYKKTVDTFIRELSIKIKADTIKNKGAMPQSKTQTYNYDRQFGHGTSYGSRLDFDIHSESRLEQPLSSLDNKPSLIDGNKIDNNVQQRPRSRLTDYKNTSFKKDYYGMDPLQTNAMEDKRPMNFLSSTGDAFYGREKKPEGLTELKNRMHGTNDFLKGFNQDIDKLLTKDRGSMSQSAYNPPRRPISHMAENNTKAFYGNDNSYYNTGYRPNDLNVYKRDGLTKPHNSNPNPLDSYLNKYGRRDNEMGLSRTLTLSSRLEPAKDQYLDSLGESKGTGGILKYKQD